MQAECNDNSVSEEFQIRMPRDITATELNSYPTVAELIGIDSSKLKSLEPWKLLSPNVTSVKPAGNKEYPVDDRSCLTQEKNRGNSA